MEKYWNILRSQPDIANLSFYVQVMDVTWSVGYDYKQRQVYSATKHSKLLFTNICSSKSKQEKSLNTT